MNEPQFVYPGFIDNSGQVFAPTFQQAARGTVTNPGPIERADASDGTELRVVEFVGEGDESSLVLAYRPDSDLPRIGPGADRDEAWVNLIIDLGS
jgi:hypothetical protein